MTDHDTSSRIWPSDDAVGERFPIFTRANTGEVFTVAATPFTWSLYGRVDYEGGFRDGLIRMGTFTAEDFGEEGHGRCVCVASFGGYVYISVSISRILGVRAPGMSPEAIDQSFFGEHPDVTPYRPHAGDEDEERSAATGAWMNRLMTAPDTGEVNDAHRREVDELIASRPDLSTLSDAALLGRAVWLADRLRPVFATHIVNLYGATIVAGLISGACAAAGRPDLEAKVISGFGDVDSAQQSFDLWKVSRLIRGSEALTAAFDAGSDGLLHRLRSLTGGDAEEFSASWDAFMERWGFIGPSVWELRSNTYASDPGIVLHMLDGARKVPDDGSPEARTASFVSEREQATAEISRLLAGTELEGPFAAAAASAPITLPGREASKVQCTRIVNEARETMHELGSRFVSRGDLVEWTDILLLMDTELEDFIASPSSWSQRIDERRALFADIETRTPPFIVDGEYPSLDAFAREEDAAAVAPARAGDTLQGLGVAPGTHTGPVKIVRSIVDLAKINPGDVLVALTTDSSWGALFLSAGAVVGETGAAVSHAAIVSRELGIPAAVSVPSAMSRLRTGMTVTVDGSTGTVTVVGV